MIETDEQALFLRYWRDRFKNDGIAAGKGLCFQNLTTRTRRMFMEAASAAAAQLDQQLNDYEKRKRR